MRLSRCARRFQKENGLRYNGMLIGVFELLADSQDQVSSVMAAIAAEAAVLAGRCRPEAMGKPTMASVALCPPVVAKMRVIDVKPQTNKDLKMNSRRQFSKQRALQAAQLLYLPSAKWRWQHCPNPYCKPNPTPCRPLMPNSGRPYNSCYAERLDITVANEPRRKRVSFGGRTRGA